MELTLQLDYPDGTVLTGSRKQYDIYPSDCQDRPVVSYYGETVQKTAFYLENKQNATLDFGGATLLLHGYIQPFTLVNCRKVTIKNVTVKYARSIVNEMTVLSRTEHSFTCKMGDNYPWRIEDGNFVSVGDGWEITDFHTAPGFMQSFDSHTREGKGIYLVAFGKNVVLDDQVPWAKDTYRMSVSQQGENLWFEGKKDVAGWGSVPAFEVGDTVAFSFAKRDLSSVYMEHCADITVENYRLCNGAGMGIVPIHCENITLDGLKLTYDEQSTGIIANDADCVHAIACRGDIVIKNSVMEGFMDDAVNIHSHFYTFVSGKNNRMTVRCQGMGSEKVCAFDAGDTIRLTRGHTLEPVCDYQILKKEYADDKQLVFTLDKPVGEHQKGDLIENLSAQCNVEIANCVFGKASTHIRLQTRGRVTLRDSQVDLPVWLTGDTNYWFEASPCEDVRIQNCVFANPTAMVKVIPEFEATGQEPYYHRKLSVENCRFRSPVAVEARFCKALQLKDLTGWGDEKPVCVVNRCGAVTGDDSFRIREEKENYHIAY